MNDNVWTCWYPSLKLCKSLDFHSAFYWDVGQWLLPCVRQWFCLGCSQFSQAMYCYYDVFYLIIVTYFILTNRMQMLFMFVEWAYITRTMWSKPSPITNMFYDLHQTIRKQWTFTRYVSVLNASILLLSNAQCYVFLYNLN